MRGKAVFVFSMPLPGSWRNTAVLEGALRMAEERGAAALFDIVALPGNIRTQLYPTRTNVPTFSMGMDDGYAIRDLLGKGSVRVKVKLDIKMTPGLKTGTVWGTLPGMTDETVNIIAHRDGWFESGSDNASGVATVVGLADYFAKVPKEKRRRTIVFAGTSGHHNGGNASGTWLLDHKDEVFKSALLINCEHTATGQTYLLGEDIRMANMYTGMLWYAGGPGPSQTPGHCRQSLPANSASSASPANSKARSVLGFNPTDITTLPALIDRCLPSRRYMSPRLPRSHWSAPVK